MFRVEKSPEQATAPSTPAHLFGTVFAGDMMQIVWVGPFQLPIYNYALSGLDIFSKYLFTVPSTSAQAANIVKSLLSIFPA